MIGFLVKRLGLMALTALVLTFVVFALTNLEPNLEKLAKEQNFSRMSDEQVASWLEKEGYNRPLVNRYAEWVIQAGSGDLGQSTRFREPVASILGPRLWLTAKLMFWVMIVMVPCALALGVLAGMREGSRTDRTLSTVAIASTATPEYVSGVILVTIFASSAVGLKWLKGSATSAAENITFENFALPVATMGEKRAELGLGAGGSGAEPDLRVGREPGEGPVGVDGLARLKPTPDGEPDRKRNLSPSLPRHRRRGLRGLGVKEGGRVEQRAHVSAHGPAIAEKGEQGLDLLDQPATPHEVLGALEEPALDPVEVEKHVADVDPHVPRAVRQPVEIVRAGPGGDGGIARPVGQ